MYRPERRRQPGSNAAAGGEAAADRRYYGSLDDENWKQRAVPAARVAAQPPPMQQHGQRRGASPRKWDRAETVHGLLFGAINASICLPASVSFATIIFRHEAFAPYLPDLVRLVLLSSAVHAAAFVSLSSMPFAVGQVQDAGLIFLSSMASTVADHCRARNLSDDALLSTALVVIALATATLGLALIGIGRLGLASIVQYLPMAAVGGYLGFLGFFMGKAGLSFMTESQLDSPQAWWHLLSDPHTLAKMAPGVGLGLGIFLVTRRVQHMLTLPGCMALAVALFYATLYALGYTLTDARALGWVAPSLPPRPFYEAWGLFNFELVQWDVLPSVLPTWLALVLVVAFSSSLDVAAIEMEVRRPLDYDFELRMIGVSNVLSGLSGGYTGSYIFSQTIFCLRNGVRGRTCAAVISLLELAAFLSPVSIIAYLPRFFFGGLLLLIALDLVLEWLWHSRRKMMGQEYAVALATFVAIAVTNNIELGMTFGVLLAVLAFALSYAEAPLSLHPRVRHSTVVRTFEERSILASNQDKVVFIPLHGYVFFGSAVRVLKAVKETVLEGHWDVHGEAFHMPVLEEEGGGEDHDSLLASREPSETQQPFPLPPVPVVSTREAASGQQQRAQSAPRFIPEPFISLASRAAAGGAGASANGSGGGGAGGQQQQSSLGASSVSSALQRPRRPRRGSRGSNSEEGTQPGSVRASSLMTPVYNRGGTWIEYGERESGAGAAAGVGDVVDGVGDLEMGQGGGGSSDDGEGGLGRGEEEEELEELLGAMEVGEGQGDVPRLMTRSQSRPSDVSSSSNMNSIASLEFFDTMSSPPRALSPTPLAAEVLRQRRPPSPSSRQASLLPARLSQEEQQQPQPQGGGVLDRYLKEWATDESAPLSSFLPTTTAAAVGGSTGGNRIRHLIFDCEHVIGIDATAARACFLMLKSLLRMAGVKVHFAAASPPVARLLRGHGVVGEKEAIYPSLDEALEACEEALLRSAAELSLADLKGLSRHPSFYAAARRSRHQSHRALRDPTGSRRDSLVEAEEALNLESILADYLEVSLPHVGKEREQEEEEVGQMLARFFEDREYPAGQALFRAGEASSSLFFLRKGVVELRVPMPPAGENKPPLRLMKVSDGGAVGELGFFLKRPQAFDAVATTRCLVYALSRPGLLALARARPQLCCLLQQAVIKSLSLSSSYAIADFNEDVSALLTHRAPAAAAVEGDDGAVGMAARG